MARLLSVNVGLPRDIAWKGRTVHTGVWKSPVTGPCRAGRLNLQGDGQGDLAGHGGEHRAVFVYQMDSYHYWEQQLKRNDFVYGQFGENFTIEGLPDDAVCIGDRYQIGNALFEVTQPRVTCFRVGIRMNEPRMASLLTSSGRPGFYFRVLREGEVSAGDEIVKVGETGERMTVTEINALLYLPGHPREGLQRALRIDALSRGWRGSFEALLQSSQNGAETGNAGLTPAAAAHPAASGFQSLLVASINRESEDVLSFSLQNPDGHQLPAALPGQYVVVRLTPTAGGPTLFRSYSLSGPVSTERYRISVKIEPDSAAGRYLREHLRAGDHLDVSSPRGSFVLQPGDRPIVLLSAGIGATPVLAMLHTLAGERSPRQVTWLHTARDGQHHPFAAEVRQLMGALANARSYICYTRPGSTDKSGDNFDAKGRFSRSLFDELKLSQDADVYLCGPNQFMTDMKQTLTALGIAPTNVHVEIFNGGESRTPGVVGAVTKAPHPPANAASTGPLVSFARSGISTHWGASRYASILEMAEACDVPVRWACRTGVCHNCESGLVSGTVVYDPEPLDKPADGNLLVCCSQPSSDVVVDL
jgi:ferredoxin-NADP reductase/MOSC domain-containing protein YiiM/ferredoxin